MISVTQGLTFMNMSVLLLKNNILFNDCVELMMDLFYE